MCIRPNHTSITTYEVIELLNLQTIRDAARKFNDTSITPSNRNKPPCNGCPACGRPVMRIQYRGQQSHRLHTNRPQMRAQMHHSAWPNSSIIIAEMVAHRTSTALAESFQSTPLHTNNIPKWYRMQLIT